jgi:hypothetical protein
MECRSDKEACETLHEVPLEDLDLPIDPATPEFDDSLPEYDRVVPLLLPRLRCLLR